MKSQRTGSQSHSHRVPVYRREVMRAGRVTSLLATETHAHSPASSPAHVATLMAARYFGNLASSCAGLVVASPTDPVGDDCALCGFSLTPAASAHVPLIRLGSPRMKARPGYARLAYPIVGGLLVSTTVDASGAPRSGSFSFEVIVVGASTTFAVRVDDFSARLLGGGGSAALRLLYQGTESLVHRVMVARFLRGFVKSYRIGGMS